MIQDLDLSLAEILPLIVALLLGGLLTGFLAGMFGIGGGGIMVPILYELFTAIGIDESVRTHLAVGTSLAVIIPTSIRSFSAHKAKGAVDMSVVRSWGAGVFIGVLFGIALTSVVDGSVLRGVYAFCAFLIALKLIFASENMKFGSQLPSQPYSSGLSVFFGIASTLMGIGGGIFISSVMTLYGRAIHQAIATSSGFGVIIAVPATLGYIWAGWGQETLPFGSFGYVSLIGAAILIPMSVWAAPYGVKASHSLSKRHLEIAFGVFLLFAAIRFIISFI